MKIYVKALFYISDFDDEQFAKVINKSHTLVTLPRESQDRQAFLGFRDCTEKMIDYIFLEKCIWLVLKDMGDVSWEF